MTREAFENAITVIIALGGSTNAVLHILAMAHTAGVDVKLDDFTRIGARVPVLADLKPSGRFLMSELVAIGGILPLMRTLLDADLLHGDCMTVTGRTMADNLKRVKPYPKGQEIIRPLSNPNKKDSHLVILYGNLAPGGAVAKISGKEGLAFTGKAIVFENEQTALAAILDGRVKKGHVIVIRHEGPVGGPGMREMLSPTSAVMGKGLGKDVHLLAKTGGKYHPQRGQTQDRQKNQHAVMRHSHPNGALHGVSPFMGFERRKAPQLSSVTTANNKMLMAAATPNCCPTNAVL
jgi:dihydroxy-acid dehydratase